MSRYKIIEFDQESQNDQKSVDIVPSHWISYNSETKNLVTKFMPPPYDEESSALLHSLVDCAAPAPEGWDEYPIFIRGEANTCQEAKKKLKKLNKKKYAYTTDDDNNAQMKANAATNKYKPAKAIDPGNKTLWQVPDLEDDENANFVEDEEAARAEKSHIHGFAGKLKADDLPKKIADISDVADGTSEDILLSEVLNLIEPNNNELLNAIKTAVTTGFQRLTVHLSKISLQLAEIESKLNDTKIEKVGAILNIGNPAENHGIQLPFKTLQDFLTFDQSLIDDAQFRNDMLTIVWHLTNPCIPVLQTARDIIKYFLSREVALQFTVVKTTGTKGVLKNTKLFSCAQDIVIKKYADFEKGPCVVTPKEFERAVGKVLNNAKDWEGYRAERIAKKRVTEETPRT